VKTALLALVVAISAAAGCGHATPTGPSSTDLTGTWSGTATYPNAPFQLVLTETGETLRGRYSDGLDSSLSVAGTLSNASMTLVVDFGDAKLNLTGQVVSPRRVEGVMYTSALGNREYPFTMTR